MRKLLPILLVPLQLLVLFVSPAVALNVLIKTSVEGGNKPEVVGELIYRMARSSENHHDPEDQYFYWKR